MLKWQVSSPSSWSPNKSSSGYLSDNSLDVYNIKNETELNYFSDTENVQFTRFSYEPNHVAYIKNCRVFSGEQHQFLFKDSKKLETDKNNFTLSNINKKLYQINENDSKLINTSNDISDISLTDVSSIEDDDDLYGRKSLQHNFDENQIDISLQELAKWIKLVTDINLPCREILTTLKDGWILKQFILKLSGEKTIFKKIRKSLPWNTTDNISCFLRQCKKFHLNENDLFTTEDWNYVTTNDNLQRIKDKEWYQRVKKILMAFFCLAGKVKSDPKCSHFIKDVNIDVFKVKDPHTPKNEFSYYSSHCTSMSTMTPLTTDSETTIKRSKRVTFEDRVIQRYCSIESISESISSITYNIYPPPQPYGDYIEPYYHKKEDLEKKDDEKEKKLKMYHSETKINGSAPYADDYYPAYRPNDDTGYRSTEEPMYGQPRAPVYSQTDQTDYFQTNQNALDTDTPEDHNTEFVTFHSYLNAPSLKKNSFKFSINSPRTRSKNRDHNNNSSFKKKKNKDPEYWVAGQAGYDTIEKKKNNKLSSQSFKYEKPTENNSAFMRAKSASNLSSSSFKREKPLNKLASLSLKQEKPFSTSTPERPLSPPYRGSEVLNTNFDITKTQNNTQSPDKNMFRNNATSFSEHPMSFGIAAMNSRDTSKYNTIDKSSTCQESRDTSKYNTFDKSSTYQESISKKEMKDLNNLLKLFDMDKVDCGTGSSEDEGTLTRNSQKEKEQIYPLKINKAIQSSKTNQITNQSIEIPKALNDVVNELLSVGNSNTLTRNNTIQLKDSYTNNKKNTLTKRSIENFFDDNNIFNEIEKLNELTIEDNSSTYYESSDCEHSLIEIDDSGIDETMPGLTKNYNKDIIDDNNKPSTSKSYHSSSTDKTESKHRSENGHRRKKHHGDRKHRHDKNENENSGIHRSHSEPRKKDQKEKDADRSESIPRSHSYSVKTKEKHDKKEKDKKEKRDKNSDSKDHRGRKKERRSEPTASKKPPTDKNTRRSEPIVTNKIRSNNEIEGGAIGVYNKTGTTQRPPLKKTISFSDKDRNVVLPVQPNEKLNPSNGVNLQRNNSVHLSPKSREYMWDTADGKQRVYVRSKEDTKNVPPPTIKSKSSAKEEFVDQLGISPEIMNMLKEEEKFWEKQQELKNWRESRTSVKNKQYERNTRNSIKSRDDSRDVYNSEKLREIEEDRMEREAARLMKVRAEQEHVLRTSKENLLKDETDTSYHYHRNDRDRNQFFNQNNNRNSYHHSDNQSRNIYANSPPRQPSSPPTRNPYQGEIRSSRSSYGSSDARSPRSQYKNNNDYEHSQNQNRQQNYNHYNSSSVTSPREYNDSSWSANSPKSPKSPKYSPTRPVNGNLSPRSNSIYERSKDSLVNSQKSNYLLQSGCFSDDDEVFLKKRPVNHHENDNRGYYSDHDSKTAGKTYNARPIIHQRKAQLNCTGCRRVISDERLMNVEGHSYYWHLKCFYCVVCRAFLNDNHAIRIRIVNYNLHCRFCYSAQNGEQLSEV